jgi:hypothetical protein
MMTPLQIQMMFHHYVTPVDWDGPLRLIDTPGFSWLRDSGLLQAKDSIDIEAGDSLYFITDKGRAYVSALMSMPLPEPCWILPGAVRPIEIQ